MVAAIVPQYRCRPWYKRRGENVKLLVAKKIVVKYYLKERGVVGTHWEERVAASRVLTELQKKEKQLRVLRREVKCVLKALSSSLSDTMINAILTDALEKTKR